MIIFFNKFKNPCFWPRFGHFYKFFGQKSTTSYGILAPRQNLEKTNDKIPRKRPDRQTDGRTDPIS